ncbi:MAG: rhodanese-like domain-containing protein [Sedimenticola sp.]|nr:rhodanese-like domain-containing protein [Sedimenticola sp.]MCW8920352.1 rhodanese-like domain-containing protein [Sedimenticola sp.]MCW8946240.1 rhodanese-like domain-containing protein [Sedimenticola sp.]MCW8974955.1 rhodanese-like domain-containing protein [Sedimenticola sp.]
MNMFKTVAAVSAVMFVLVGPLFGADEEVVVGAEGGVIPLYKDKPYLHVIHNGRSVKVQRVQDTDFELHGYFAKTSRQCPPFCLGPMEVNPLVKTVGELEVFHFMENQLRDGTGLLIDARTPEWHAKGTIPGSINVPFTTLSKSIDDLEMIEALEMFGGKPREKVGTMTKTLEQWGVLGDKNMTDKWDFTNCKELILWCNGPACGQSPRAIMGLLEVGYPPEKIHYYRGGMQVWQLYGLTTVN